jgi:hypothetical protein
VLALVLALMLALLLAIDMALVLAMDLALDIYDIAIRWQNWNIVRIGPLGKYMLA